MDFTEQEILVEYQKTNNTSKEFNCEICGKNFKEQHRLNVHSLTHIWENHFKCEACGQSFPREYCLILHLLCHDEEKNYECGDCGQNFFSKKNLVDHVLNHVREEKFECAICRKIFTDKNFLKEHMMIHCEDTNFENVEFDGTVLLEEDPHPTGEEIVLGNAREKESCAKSYVDHVLNHVQEEKFECAICRETFTDQNSLEEHAMMHCGVKNFENVEFDGIVLPEDDVHPTGEEFILGSARKKESCVDHVLNHVREEKFECSICRKIFTDQNFLKEHMTIHCEDKNFENIECNGNVLPEDDVHTTMEEFVLGNAREKESCAKSCVDHVLNHVLEEKFECAICRETFTDQNFLDVHMMIHYEGENFENVEFVGNVLPEDDVHTTRKEFVLGNARKEEFVCLECNKSFSKKSRLYDHRRVHTKEKFFLCEYCGHSFSWKKSLKRHLRYHTGEKLFICEICGKLFAAKHELLRHLKIHNREKQPGHVIRHQTFRDEEIFKDRHKPKLKEKPQSKRRNVKDKTHRIRKIFSCSECKKCFSKKSTFTIHFRIHTGEKPFKCGFCEKSFRNTSNYNQHQKVHLGDENFSCNECHQRFSRKQSLNVHMRAHTVKKLVERDSFNKNLDCNSELIRLLKGPTKEILFKCELCEKNFSDESNYKHHLRTHFKEIVYA